MPHFLYTQFFAKNKPVTQNLSGRTVCVTGSNIGLGLATAVHLARLDPAKVILAVRNVEKGEAAKLKVVEQSGIAPDRVVVWKLDLETFAGVEAFADKCNNELDRLDVLIQNAGVISQDGFKTSPDGHELTIQVNDLSTGLLAILLLPLLRKTAKLPSPNPASAALKTHLTIVSSEVHSWAAFTERTQPSALAALDDAKFWTKKTAADRYNVSKLINVFMTHGLADLAKGSNIVVNTVNPALCVSELRRDMKGIVPRILDMMARTAEDGGACIGWAGTEDTSSKPGAYVSFCEIVAPQGLAAGPDASALEAKIWKELLQEWNKVPKAKTILEGKA